MSISQNTRPSVYSDINWERILRLFGRQYDMQFSETLRWVSNRSSLQVACEILGIALSPSMPIRYTSADMHILSTLGDFLWVRGYQVPKIMEHHKMEYVRKEKKHMGFSLSREEYLKERAAGKSKNKIAHQQGISGPALFHWLDKWGLKDAAVEQKEIERVIEELHTEDIVHIPIENEESICPDMVFTGDSHSPNKTSVQDNDITFSRNKLTLVPKSQLDIADVSDSHAENLHIESKDTPLETAGLTMKANKLEVQLCMPLTPALLPETIQTSSLSRDELMQKALCLFQNAVHQAYSDLVELLGEEHAKNQIQQYVDHQIDKFFNL